MTVRELYEQLCVHIPDSLREPWDNDGLMCCVDESAEVSRVLVALDVTEEIVDYAIEHAFDLIVSHHPLIFHPVTHINESANVSRKLIKLIGNGLSVFSFHTRADKVSGGVNDILGHVLGLRELRPFGEGDLGRIGVLPQTCPLEDYAEQVKEILNAPGVLCADGYNPVRTVAVVGGDGKDFLADAVRAGADTYVSGRIGYNLMEEAAERGINLIEAGHYFTEFPVTGFFANLLSAADPNLTVSICDSNMLKLI